MCKHCEEGVPIINGKHLGFCVYPYSNGSNSYARGYDKQGWDVSKPVVLNFCPMCGKKLESK